MLCLFLAVSSLWLFLAVSIFVVCGCVYMALFFVVSTCVQVVIDFDCVVVSGCARLVVGSGCLYFVVV